MVFPVLRNWSGKRFHKTKNARSKMATGLRIFRPVVEQLEHRNLLSTVIPISLANGGPSVTPNGDSTAPLVSADGRYVAFDSMATNIVPGQNDTNAANDVFLYDRLTATTVLVSHSSESSTRTANGDSRVQSMSSDGRFIVFESRATNLVTGQVDSNNFLDVFLYDRLTDTNTLISHTSSSLTTTGDHGAIDAQISADGNFIVLLSQSIDLIAGETSAGTAHLEFLWSKQTGSLILISHSFSSTTTAANGESKNANINADGSAITFESAATDLINGFAGTPNADNIFLFNRLTGDLVLISHASGSLTTAGNNVSQLWVASGAISADGRFVVYSSYAHNLASGLTYNNLSSDAYLYDSSTGSNTLVSHSYLGMNITSNRGEFYPIISPDGNTIAFASPSTDLVSGQQDNNNTDDVFIYYRSTGQISLVSHVAGDFSTTGNGLSEVGDFSFDGSDLIYSSSATNLVAGQIDSSGTSDAFLYQKATGLNTLISHVPGSDITAGNGSFGFTGGIISGDGQFVVFESDASDLVAGDLNNHSDIFGTEPFDAPLTATGTVVTSAMEQTPFTATIATFTDPDPSTPQYFKATINWGDGAVSAGTISANGGGFNVSGSHTYSSEGSYQVLVQIADVGGSTAAANSVVRVAEIGASITGHAKDSGQIWTGVTTGSSFTTTMWGAWNPGVTWVDVLTGDFNGDGEADIAGRDLSTGNWWVGLSNGSSFTNSFWTTWNPKLTWVDVQVGDFNGDGKADIGGRVLQSGQWWVAQSSGSSFTNSLWTTWNPMATWVDVKVGDFNGDGKADIIGRYSQAGQWWAGISSGSAFSNSLWATWNPAAKWVDVQVGDFNGDGKADITGRVLDAGTWWTGTSTGSSLMTSLWGMWNPNVTWVDVKVGDFSGDGKDDIIGRVLQNGQWWAGISTGTTFSNSLWSTWSTGVTWVDVQVGDFNGDGKADITGRALQTGQWWTGISNGSTFSTSLWASWSTAVNWVDVRSGDFA